MTKGNKDFWEARYANKEGSVWGLNPIHTLVDYASLVDKRAKVLDLGMGEGRNALYFARMGFEVEGVDISETAIDRSLSYAKEMGLSLKAEVNHLTRYTIEENSYSLIIIANVLSFFKEEEIEHIIEKAKNGLVDGGLLYIHAFDRNDPGYEVNREKAQQISASTFYRPASDSYVHYFTREELEAYFEDYQMIKVSETYLLDVSHGEPHYHGTVEMVVRK